MDAAIVVVLAAGAFLLGACPFAVWIGKWALKKDIRSYGDGNPGSTNVFRAGSKFWGGVAVAVEMCKAMPFILIARLIFDITMPTLYLIAFSAILGHAFSPFLNFRGGKALAVFGGAALALPQLDIFASMIILLFLCALFIGNDSWVVMISTLGTLAMLMVTRADTWEILFVCAVTIVFIIKHFRDLWSDIMQPGRLIVWIRSKRKAV
ncbi:MAG: glycerol-3-phosphate acyltransferase [Dehalococcoidia bacterium]